MIDHDLLLLGDFNAKNSEWFNGDCTNPNGIALKDLTDHFDLTQLCRQATHLNHDGEPESLLDLVFTNVPELFSNSARVLPPISSSDHLPVVIQNKSAEYFNPQKTQTYTKWIYHQKDQDKMNDAFLLDDWTNVFLHTDIDEMWTQWKSRFFSEVKKFIPCVEPQFSKRPHSRISPPWFNNDTRRLVRAKNRLFKRAQLSGSSEHWKIYRAARNKATTAVKTAKHQHLTLQAARLADPNCSSPRWWQIAKEMCGLKGNSLRNIPPLADQSLGLVCEDHKKADLLNDTFINSNTSISQNSFPIGPTKLGSIFEFQELSSDDVKKAIRSLPNKTSTGPDRISYRLLKEAGPNVVGPLTTLYNYSLRTQKIPEEWKMAVVSPIFKGGHRDRDKPSNYRPISLTSCVARLMEKLLNAQILRYLENHSLLYQHQSGFLPGHSTVTQLCFLVNQWQMAADQGDHVQATFLDLSKAYDRVSIPGLLFKLSCLGFSYSALQWLSTFLTKRLQSVKVNGCQSKWQTPKSGIPQGTVLGPVLFLVFINDLPLSLQNGCSIFADDTTAYTIGDTVTSTCSALSLDLAAASSWAKTWGMLYNAEKSEHLPINTNGRGNVDMDGTIIPQVTAHKHLGVMLNQKLTWNNHIDNLYTSCARRVGILRRLRNKLQPPVFKKIFIGSIRPKLEYACAVWSGGPITKLIRLQEAFCHRHKVHLPPLQKRFQFHSLVLLFKMRQKLSPRYLSSLLPETTSTSSMYNLRKSSYPVPVVNKKSTLRSFLPRAIIL